MQCKCRYSPALKMSLVAVVVIVVIVVVVVPVAVITATRGAPTRTNIVIAPASTTHATCFNYSDGSAAISVEGGIFPYAYTWSNGDTTQNITSLVAGVYSVTVVDSAGTNATHALNITQPVQLLLPAPVAVDATCFAGIGGLTASASDGAGPYVYAWSNGDSGAALTAARGIYNVTVTDALGCTASARGVIGSVHPELNVAVAVVNAPCGHAANGPATASVSAVASGGVPPYAYFWNDRNTGTGTYATQNLTGLPGDTLFRLTVTDGAACTNVQYVEFDAPPWLSNPSAAAAPLIPCIGGMGGVAVTAVVGGTQPYSYLWSTGATTDSISGVPAAVYIISITDANGCTSGGASGGAFSLRDPASPVC